MVSGRIVPCRRCGAFATFPPPSAEQLREAYAGWYRPASGRFAGPGDWVLARTRARVARRLDRIAPPGPVLDVGAGDGTLVRALRARDREATGVDPFAGDPDVTAADPASVEGEWAAAVFWHSLEHMPDAGAVLAHVTERLLPGGMLVIAIPNIASLQSRAWGDRWFALDLPRHVLHLSAEVLTTRLTALGLQVQRVSHWRGGQGLFGWVDGVVGALPGDLDLYAAIRRPPAQSAPQSRGRRALTVAAAGIALPVAATATGVEVALRRGGSVYVEARRD
jgi:methyltransferase family protein